jgi:Flp pilus assembly secretin CpaC
MSLSLETSLGAMDALVQQQSILQNAQAGANDDEDRVHIEQAQNEVEIDRIVIADDVQVQLGVGAASEVSVKQKINQLATQGTLMFFAILFLM